MDDLSDEERVAAWKAAWHTSFAGWAIVEEDFVFRSINPQWLELLGVLPSEFIGKTFSDITTPDIRRKDEENAALVKQGKVNSYLIHKAYQFEDLSIKKVVLLVVRVPLQGHLPFQFYLSRILLDEEKLVEDLAKELGKSASASALQSISASMLDFAKNYWVWIMGASAAATGVALEIYKVL